MPFASKRHFKTNIHTVDDQALDPSSGAEASSLSAASTEQRSLVARVLPLVHFFSDAAVWLLVIPVANSVRRDFDTTAMFPSSWLDAVIVAILLQGIAGYLTGLYRRRWRYGSFEEVLSVATSVFLTGGALMLISAVAGTGFLHPSVAFISTVLVLTISVAARSMWRLWRQSSSRPSHAESVVVIGAGQAGYEIARHLLDNPHSAYVPVAFVDDDPLKTQFRMRGIKVEGTICDLAKVAAASRVNTVLLAIPSAPIGLVRDVKVLCDEAHLKLLVLPSVTELFGAPIASDIRPVTTTDLLGRRQVDVDTAAVAQYITGKRVLVTGAGGSIGSELCRQLARFEPAELMMLDRDESGLHGVQLSIEGRALLTSPDLILADLRDAERIDQIIATRRPEVIFHAAALKHLSLLEMNPTEAWKTNVVGTHNLLTAARRHQVPQVVNISTDKAADPTCVLGSTKRITERLTADVAHGDEARYLSVRFGNVLGSRGSVLTTFETQAASGGPITLTDPEVTRYFMTITEAVTLTIYAGAIGNAGQVLVLDMGAPVRIADVAERFARRVSPPLEIVHTGLRKGEKVHEVLFGTGETDTRPVHPLISHVDVAPLGFDECVTVFAAASTHPERHNDPAHLACTLAEIATSGIQVEPAEHVNPRIASAS
jgi:FlaA1/EpsC-like NDP-sugar epimerase